ncbi:KRAB [Acanthosepion pharaonis]|uniref:KRAB n=1 Tax=Acanthosepion pharaonis TaxID=158019 RepID=A0A812C8P8_ACAPH|nr:KRAB [Sepia pharaonis]
MKNHERTHHGVGLEAGGPNGVLIANGTGEGGQNGVMYLPRERPYLCGVCHKSFARKDHLRKHQRTHTGERPFQCGVCMKAFSRRDHLKKHQRTHSGEKPYECFVCSKAYSRKDHLNKHERTHTTGEMLPTVGAADNNNGDCGIGAGTIGAPANSTQQQQQQQQQLLIDQKPPKCKYCPKIFATQNQLDLHELTHNQTHEELHGSISINLNSSSGLSQPQPPPPPPPQHIQLTNVPPLQQISLQQQQPQQQLTTSSSTNVHQLLSQPVVATTLRQPLLQTAPGQTATITISPGSIAPGNYTPQPITLQQPVAMATANHYAWTNGFPVSSTWATGWVNPNLYTLDQQKCEGQETTHNIQTLLQ